MANNFILFLIFFQAFIMEPNCQVVSKETIEELLGKNQLEILDFHEQLRSGAFLYEVPEDTFIIYIMMEDYGLIVKGKAAVEKMILEDNFPIEIIPTKGQPIEFDKANIRHINKRSKYYQELLNSKTGLTYTTITEQSLKDYLAASRLLYQKSELGNDGILALTSIAGEFAIAKFHGRWALLKVYWGGYNPSFEPHVIKSNQKLLPVYFYVTQFLGEPNFNIDSFMQYAFNSIDFNLNNYQVVRDLIILD